MCDTGVKVFNKSCLNIISTLRTGVCQICMTNCWVSWVVYVCICVTNCWVSWVVYVMTRDNKCILGLAIVSSKIGISDCTISQSDTKSLQCFCREQILWKYIVGLADSIGNHLLHNWFNCCVIYVNLNTSSSIQESIWRRIIVLRTDSLWTFTLA